MNSRVAILFLGITISFGSGCSLMLQRQANSNRDMVTSNNDAVLMELVTDYAGDNDDQDNKTWNQIQKYPREELVRNLVRLTKELPPGDDRQVSLAFVLCRLNHDYESNREVILTALAKKPPFQPYMGDWAASLVDRLIEHGDKSILKNLFESTRVSDGAMTASLSGYFTKHFRTDTYTFLAQLSFEPPDIKENVFAGIRHDEMLTEAELLTIKDRLRRIAAKKETFNPTASDFNRNVDLRPIAEEMLQALSNKGGTLIKSTSSERP